MELRRAASGLVKVICRTEESRPFFLARRCLGQVKLRRVVQMGEGKSQGNPNRKGCLQASRNGLDPSI